MSILGREIPWWAVGALTVALSVGALFPVLTQAPEREITLVVRGMAFFVEGDLTRPNPEIVVRRGERVRIHVRNEERGVTHDFAVPSLHTATELLDWNDADSVVLEAPEAPGDYPYVCNPHKLMMRGTLRVR